MSDAAERHEIQSALSLGKIVMTLDLPGDSVVKNPAASAGDASLIPRLERSGEGNGSLL